MYIFKRFMLPFATLGITQEKKQQQELQERGELLTQNIRYVHEEQKQQELLYRTLYERLLVWKKSVSEEQEQKIAAYNRLHSLVEKKRQKQFEHTMFERVQRVVLNDAINQARQEIIKRFDDVEEGRHYIQKVVDTLKDM
jgi:hypothetical protein